MPQWDGLERSRALDGDMIIIGPFSLGDEHPEVHDGGIKEDQEG